MPIKLPADPTSPSETRNILSLQPFWGGSHRQFAEGWQRHSCHRWHFLTMPPRHWKWRMRHAAIGFAQQLKKESAADYDLVFATSMLNLAEWKALAGAEWAKLPTILYFHENQFEYPNRFPDQRDLHFGFTQFVSALAADQIWFNSDFNRDTFFRHLDDQLSRMPDFNMQETILELRSKSQIGYPGIDVPKLDSHRSPNPAKPIHLLWAARWEHDKDPASLLKILRHLRTVGVAFELSVIGETFNEVPTAFESIRNEFTDCIRHFGFQESREAYWRVLSESDLFLSTASHEFFGLAAVEAIAAGNIPLLPNRLAYPETIGIMFGDQETDDYLYGSEIEAVERIEAWSRKILSGKKAIPGNSNSFSNATKQFHWDIIAGKHDQSLQECISLNTS